MTVGSFLLYELSFECLRICEPCGITFENIHQYVQDSGLHLCVSLVAYLSETSIDVCRIQVLHGIEAMGASKEIRDGIFMGTDLCVCAW